MFFKKEKFKILNDDDYSIEYIEIIKPKKIFINATIFMCGCFIFFLLVYIFYKNNIIPPIKIETEYVINNVQDDNMTQDNFLKSLGYIESNNTYSAREKDSLYLGYYQIGKQARIVCGCEDISINKFLNSKNIQEQCVRNLMKKNWEYLKSKNCDDYIGKIINGILITKSGLIAGAHAGGCVGVIKYLESNGKIIVKDSNGKSVEDYLRLAGYVLDIE